MSLLFLSFLFQHQTTAFLIRYTRRFDRGAHKQVQGPRTRSYREKRFLLYSTYAHVPGVCGISISISDTIQGIIVRKIRAASF